MLGDVLAEGRGQVLATRVLPSDGKRARMEVSAEATGKVLGMEAHEHLTYQVTLTDDATLTCCGQGVIVTNEGDTATFNAEAVGHFVCPTRGTTLRGAAYFETGSERLSRLKGTMGVVEASIDESGKTEAKVWEWK